MHTLDLGAVEQNFARQAERFGASVPDRIANAPELMLGLELYFDAFLDLNRERNTGMDLGSIPWSKIKDYAQFYRFSDEQTNDLFFFIKKMDSAYLNRENKKKQSQKKA